MKNTIIIVIMLLLPVILTYPQLREVYTKPDYQFSLYERIPFDYEKTIDLVKKYYPNFNKDDPDTKPKLPYMKASQDLDLLNKGYLKIYKSSFQYGEIDTLLFQIDPFVGSNIFIKGNYFRLEPPRIEDECIIVYNIDDQFTKLHNITSNPIITYEDEASKKIMLKDIDVFLKKGLNKYPVFEDYNGIKIQITDNDFYQKYNVILYRIVNVPMEDFCLISFFENKKESYSPTSFLFSKGEIINAGYYNTFTSFTIDKKWYLTFHFQDNSDAGWGKYLYVFENGLLKIIDKDSILY